MSLERTRRIGAAFSAAADAYDQAAQVQARVADALAARLDPRPGHARLVEIGCGTGLLTRHLPGLIGPAGRILATDLSPAMIRQARRRVVDPRVSFAVMDAQAPALAPGGADLIVSSLAAQWFPDLPAALAGLARALAPGGTVVISTLGSETFAAWRAAHAAEGVESGLAAYPDAGQLAAMAPPGGGTRIERERIEIAYADALVFARGLAATGAVVPRPGHRPLPSGTLRRIIGRLGAPCRLGWDILTLTFTKDATHR